jgi:endonuclease/exonuclease/phosphatase family metal-dependent hydrolase
MAIKKIFGITSRLLMMIVAGLLILSYLSILINPAKVWLISLVGLLFVPLSLLNAFLLLWAMKRMSKSFVIPLLALLPAFFFVGRYVRVDTEEERIDRMNAEGERLTVVSYNVGRFALQDQAAGIDSRAECVDSVFSFLKAQDADIICLQEFRVPDADKLKSYVNRHMKGYNAEYYMFPTRSGAFGNVTLSRLPVKGKGKIKFDESANLAIYSDYEYAGEKFRVYNCHFESYNVSVSGLMRGLVQRDSVLISTTGDKMKRSITRRPKQVDMVFEHIEKCPLETFVCGDFNDNPMSYTYYRMTRGRKDTFKEAGNGFGASFAAMWPMLRIDYILCPEKYNPISHKTPRVPYSDHYPVVAQLAL